MKTQNSWQSGFEQNILELYSEYYLTEPDFIVTWAFYKPASCYEWNILRELDKKGQYIGAYVDGLS